MRRFWGGGVVGSTKECTKVTLYFCVVIPNRRSTQTGPTTRRRKETKGTPTTREISIFSTTRTGQRKTDARREKHKTVTFKLHQEQDFFSQSGIFFRQYLYHNYRLYERHKWATSSWTRNRSLVDGHISITHDLGSLFGQWSICHLERNRLAFTRWWMGFGDGGVGGGGGGDGGDAQVDLVLGRTAAERGSRRLAPRIRTCYWCCLRFCGWERTFMDGLGSYISFLE